VQPRRFGNSRRWARPLTAHSLRVPISRDMVQTQNVTALDRSDRVAIALPNGPEMAVALMAVAASATSARLNPACDEAKFDFCLIDLKSVAYSSDGHISTNHPL
jgi:acyl-CoA synthetase (AMP-forming)/AMP-acid ligase II